MRTALRMIREEQGADAVILSNRAIAGGIEVVAATDYDESLVTQALRAAAPGLETITVAAAGMTIPPPAAASLPTEPTTFSSIAAHIAATTPTPVAQPAARPATVLAERIDATAHVAPSPSVTASPRESLVSRARAVFRISDSPTLAELSAAAQAEASQSAAAAAARSSLLAVVDDNNHDDVADDVAEAAPNRFEAMMAALASRTDSLPTATPVAPMANAPMAIAPMAIAPMETRPVEFAPAATATTTDSLAAITAASMSLAPMEPSIDAPLAANFKSDDWASAASDYEVMLQSCATPVVPVDEVVAETIMVAPSARTAPALQIVASAAPEPVDPSLVAMREDLAGMRQLIERQMEQLSLQRLRGCPGRAAAYDALISYGCEDALAQAVAAKLDARLDPSQIQAPMFAELASMLTIARNEVLDEGGVIALVGPTGAGKTTTAAKLAARYAARHSARDVALVTTDGERAGAREQLHAHGRRLGITVCEAAGPEGLQDTLAQLGDYPLVLVDTTGYAPRDRALFGQILWLRAARKVRSLLVLPANAHPHDLGEVIRRYRPAAPEGVVLTKLDETGRLGSALSVAVRHGLTLAYTTHGQQVPTDIDTADATRLAETLEKLRRAADNPLATEDRHAFA
jgi:flagellar biosynthesis protein FlhF